MPAADFPSYHFRDGRWYLRTLPTVLGVVGIAAPYGP